MCKSLVGISGLLGNKISNGECTEQVNLCASRHQHTVFVLYRKDRCPALKPLQKKKSPHSSFLPQMRCWNQNKKGCFKSYFYSAFSDQA